MIPGIRTVTTRGVVLVAVCKKCGKKVGGGFGPRGKQSLAKALRQTLDLPKWKRSPVRLVETGCMKLCPRGAVAVTTSSAPALVHVVPADTPVTEVAVHLGLPLPTAAHDLPLPTAAHLEPPLPAGVAQP